MMLRLFFLCSCLVAVARSAEDAPTLTNGIYVLETTAPASGTASVPLTVGGRSCYALTPALVADGDMLGASPGKSALGFMVFVQVTDRARQALNSERAKAANGQRLLYVVLDRALRGPFSLDSDLAAGDPMFVIFPHVDATAGRAALDAFVAARPAPAAGAPAKPTPADPPAKR